MDAVSLVEWLAPFARSEAVDWEAAYREELPRVFNYFRYRLADRATAEDLTSATFVKAWRARGRYRRDRASLSTWLLAIARNVATDHFRRAGREVPLGESEPEASDNPELEAERRAERRRLAALLASLPERERELLALKYGAGATNRAIARLTGLSESNVGTILHRTIGSLRAAWDDRGGRS
jgi:RNA polymerase sigma-70 factor (ECF subfamily)